MSSLTQRATIVPWSWTLRKINMGFRRRVQAVSRLARQALFSTWQKAAGRRLTVRPSGDMPGLWLTPVAGGCVLAQNHLPALRKQQCHLDFPRRSFLYRDRRQDVALEMERNKPAAKQSQIRPSNQLLLSSPPFPVRHPGADHGSLYTTSIVQSVSSQMPHNLWIILISLRLCESSSWCKIHTAPNFLDILWLFDQGTCTSLYCNY